MPPKEGKQVPPAKKAVKPGPPLQQQRLSTLFGPPVAGARAANKRKADDAEDEAKVEGEEEASPPANRKKSKAERRNLHP
jgi:hypothetical protein